MIDILDDMEFLEFVKQSIEWQIENQESLKDISQKFFKDKQIDYEISKELHKYEKWRDMIQAYIVNKRALGGILNEEK